MSDILPTNNDNNNEFSPDGSRPNDFIDGVAITIVFAILIIGAVYYLINH